MANFLTVVHECKDYATWKKGYDADKPARDAAGMTELHVLRETKNPNLIAIMFELSDVSKAKALASSPKLAETMKAAGIIGEPRIRFRTGTYTRATASTYGSMSATVKDFDTSLKAYAMDAADRKAAGLTDHAVLQEIGNPGEILLLWAVQDTGRADAFFQSPKLAEHMAKNAGVVGKPELHYWKS